MKVPTMKYPLNNILTIIALLLGGAGFVVSINVDDNNPATPPRVITFKVNDQKGDNAPTVVQSIPAPVVAQAAVGLESGLKTETPSIAPPPEIQAMQKQVEKVQATQPPLPVAGASAGFAGCATRFVNNQSSRHGVRPIYQVLHYTVSPNRPGWSDVNAVVALFDRTSSQASSNFVIDAEGHCAYIVPIEAKAWTQAAGNPLSISYEIINSGRESAFMASPGYARLESVMTEVSHRTGIPMRAGNAAIGKSGIVQHKDGGLAWGGHVDITPYSSSQVIKILTASVVGPGCTKYDACLYSNIKKLTPGEKSAALALLRERSIAHRHGGWKKISSSHLKKAVAAKTFLVRKRAAIRKSGLTDKLDRRLRYAVIGRIVAAA